MPPKAPPTALPICPIGLGGFTAGLCAPMPPVDPPPPAIVFPLSKSSRFLCHLWWLFHELLSGFFPRTLCTRCCSVLRRAKSFNCSFREVSFTCVRRFFTTLGSPLLIAPVLKGLLRRFQSLYPPPAALYFLATNCAFLADHCPAPVP